MELALKWTGIIFTILGGIFTALGVCLAVFTGVLPLAMFAGFGLVFLLLGIGMLWARTRARARAHARGAQNFWKRASASTPASLQWIGTRAFA